MKLKSLVTLKYHNNNECNHYDIDYIKIIPKNDKYISFIGKMSIRYLDSLVLNYCIDKGYTPSNDDIMYIFDMNLTDNDCHRCNKIINYHLKNYEIIVMLLKSYIINIDWIKIVINKTNIFDTTDYYIDYKLSILSLLAEIMEISREQIFELFNNNIFVNIKSNTYDYSQDIYILYHKFYNALIKNNHNINLKTIIKIFNKDKIIVKREKFREIYEEKYSNKIDIYCENISWLAYLNNGYESITTNATFSCINNYYHPTVNYDEDSMEYLENTLNLLNTNDLYTDVANATDIQKVNLDKYSYSLIKQFVSYNKDDNMIELKTKCYYFEKSTPTSILSPKIYYFLIILIKIKGYINSKIALDINKCNDEDIKEIGDISVMYCLYDSFNKCFTNGYIPSINLVHSILNIRNIISLINTHYDNIILGSDYISNNDYYEEEVNKYYNKFLESHINMIKKCLFNITEVITIDDFININKNITLIDHYMISDLAFLEIVRAICPITEQIILKLYENNIFFNISNIPECKNIVEDLYYIAYIAETYIYYGNDITTTYKERIYSLRKQCKDDSYTIISRFISRYNLSLDQYCINNLYNNQNILCHINKNQILLPPPSEHYMFLHNGIKLSNNDFKYFGIERDTKESLSKKVIFDLFKN